MNLNTPAIHTGQISAADLEAARKHSTGTVRLVPAGCGQYRWPERRFNFPDTGPTDHGELGWLDSCAPEGGKARSPAPAMESMLKHRRNVTTIKYAAALAVAVAVVGYVVQASA
jgi:hypothetical protein